MFFLIILSIPIFIYLFVCGLLFLYQEKLIFYPEKLDKDHQFQFNHHFEEIKVYTSDKIALHGLLFKADRSKGLIFYLHGNAGSINSWGEDAKTYVDLNYDVFLLDYRGYGKSEGSIGGQEQIFQDVQTVYEALKKKYQENKIVVLGYSIGTGLASKVASINNPKLLILQAPYYSLTDMMRHTYIFLPTFLLKYKFKTHEFLTKCKMPIIIFHGKQDDQIYYGSSLKLKEQFKHKITLIPLEGQGHNGMVENLEYQSSLQKILARDK